MPKIVKPWAGLLFAVFLVTGCKKESSNLDPELLRFTDAKESQAQAIVQRQELEMPSEGWKLFKAVRTDDFSSASNLFARLESMRAAGPVANPVQPAVEWLEKRGLYTSSPAALSAIESPAWHALLDTYWAYALSKHWNKKFLDLYASAIFAVIPEHAALFAGSDPSRFTISAKSASASDGSPFFVISHNQLADFNYLTYVSLMFSNRISFPSESAFQKSLDSYNTDLLKLKQRRAVMNMNGRLAKDIFDENSEHEFYIQQSTALEWTYPHLVPSGPILKINREPLVRLPDQAIAKDREYWSQMCARLIGDWVTESTTPTEVCAFIEKVYLRGDLSDFKGDPDYVADTWAQDGFAELRFAMADLYLWRCTEASQVAEKQLMLDECLLAFEQAFALGPRNSRMTYYFADVLAQINRYDEALRILDIGISLQPTDPDLKAKRVEIKARAKSATSN
jgi:tetratricopeptide (TPR) repeat protein